LKLLRKLAFGFIIASLITSIVSAPALAIPISSNIMCGDSLPMTEHSGFFAIIGNAQSAWQYWGNPGVFGGNLTADLTDTGYLGNCSWKISIPAGTVLSSSISKTTQCNYINATLWTSPDEFRFAPNGLQLSQPATWSKLVNGQWVVVTTFTKIVDGKLQ
jgi:hypothetical protein